MGRANDTYGARIFIAMYSTNLYILKHIDSLLNPLYTHQYHERTAEHIICERLKKCTLIAHQVIGSIPTWKGPQVLGALL